VGGGGFTSQNTQYFKNVPVTGGEIHGSFSASNDYGLISGLTIVLPMPLTQLGSLKIAKSEGSVVVSWDGPGTLQSSSDVTTGWTDVGGASSPFTITPGSGQTFYRLRQ
jgi:hypothetical protein